MQAN
jgi:hypothetical protein